MKRAVSVPKTTEKIIEKVTENVVEIHDEEGGYIDLLGKHVVVICDTYIYDGDLTGVNSVCIELTNPKIVYDTGKWSASNYALVENLPAKNNKSIISILKIETIFEK